MLKLFDANHNGRLSIQELREGFREGQGAGWE
jgi:Ca2+-binding EF-hand superfamily protein